MSTETENAITQYLKVQFENIPWLPNVTTLPLIGVGGSFRNIGEISKKNNISSLAVSNNYPMKAKEVLNIYNLIKNINLTERKKIRGLSKDRADIFLGAYSIISTIINYCSISEVIISNSGLRQGLIHEIINNQSLISSLE